LAEKAIPNIKQVIAKRASIEAILKKYFFKSVLFTCPLARKTTPPNKGVHTAVAAILSALEAKTVVAKTHVAILTASIICTCSFSSVLSISARAIWGSVNAIPTAMFILAPLFESNFFL